MNSAFDYRPSSVAPTRKKSSITEVVSTNEDDGLELLLPMLAYLSQQSKDRWFTWVAPKKMAARVTKQALSAYGFALEKVRVISLENNADILRFAWDALANGTSANVVASLDALSESDRAQLENACQHGASRGLVLRTR